MLRDPALKTKHTEIQKCVTSRKRKLSELYSVIATVNATVNIPPSAHDTSLLPKFTEVQFQDANDITKGRAFNLSNLLRIPDLSGEHSSNTYGVQKHSHQNVVGHAGLLSQGSQSSSSTYKNGQVDPFGSSKKNGTGSLRRGSADDVDDRMEGTVSHLTSHQDLNVRSLQDDTRLRSLAASTHSQSQSTLNGDSGDNHISNDGGQAANQPLKGVEKQKATEPIDLVPELVQNEKVQKPPISELFTAAASLTPDAQSRQKPVHFSDIQSPGITAGSFSKPSDHSPRPNPMASSTTSQNSSEDSTIASRRQGSSQEQRSSGMTNGTSKDLMLSQKPPMRIDTTIGRPMSYNEATTPGSSFTQIKSGMQSSPPERMTTRVSSGALRHKSVSEILGETSKTGTVSGDKTQADLPRCESQSLSRQEPLIASPESGSLRSRLGDREKDRGKQSTVVFVRPSTGDKNRAVDAIAGQLGRRSKPDEKDYLVPLFAAQAVAQKPTLDELIRNSHKTLDTANWYIHHHESQDCRILKRIYHLQNSNRWSFRQIERSVEPPRPSSHWDSLLNEAKWMRTDFREERKWKLAAARNLAEACAELVNAPESVRPSLQIRIRKPDFKAPTEPNRTTPVSTPNAMEMKLDGTPELVPSAEDDLSDAPEELPLVDITKVSAPAALFTLAPEDVLFSLDKTPAADKLLEELPLYLPFLDPRGTDKPCGEILDNAWQKPLIPVSKFTLGKLVTKDEGPPRKRSRYEYAQEDETEFDSAGQALLPLDQKRNSLPPEKDDVALFNPKNKHIIARLHAAHAFRPPSEFPMPSQQFFESRSPSQWTLAEDDELRRLVRDYEYNWSMISACLSSPSLFSSGAERRTPWECFERWESFEGLPGDMDKHSYFRAWRSRRQNAKQLLEQRFIEQQQIGNTAPIRRRTAEPMHVERRRHQKHLTLIHAMSKVAKKKETALQKQQHAASMAAMRKASEPSQRKLIMQTPKQFSDHKHKQEQEFKEKQMLYRQQVAASQRAIMNQKAAQQSSQQHGLTVPQSSRAPLPGQLNGASPRLASSLPHGATQTGGRPLPPSQAMLNGMVPNIGVQNGQMNMRPGVSVPNTQMQAYLQGQQPQSIPNQGIQDSARVMMAARTVQEQQRMMQQRQFQNQANSANGTSHNGNTNMQMQANSSMHNNLQSNGKINANQSNSVHQRNSSSTSIGAAGQGQQLSSGVVPLLNQFTSQIRAQHPNLTSEQVKQLATMNLNQHLRAQNSQAGNNLNTSSTNGQIPQGIGFNQSMNPQLYAHMLRSQQASQQHRNGGESSGQRPASQGATPKQGNGPNGTSQSPHNHHAQVAGTS